MQKSKPLEEKYIASLTTDNRSPDTIYTYLQTLRSSERFFLEKYGLSIFNPADLEVMTVDHIDAWKNNLTASAVSDASRKVYYARLRSYLKWAYLYCDVSPKLGIAINSFTAQEPPEDPNRIYSDNSVAQMIKLAQAHHNPVIAARNAAIIAMLAGTAMRGIELVSLTVGDYHNSRSTQVLTKVRRKGGATKSIAYAAFVQPYVDLYLSLRSPADEDEPLFASTRINPATGKAPSLDRRELRRAISNIQKMAGVKTGVHNFRHTVVTRIAETSPTGIAASVAGHSTVNTTLNHYIDLNDEQRRSVVDALPLNQMLRKY